MSLAVRRQISNVSSGLDTSKVFTFVFRQDYRPSIYAYTHLSDRYHIQHLPTTQRYATRIKKGLWCYFSASKIVGKAVVRRWCLRRLKIATACSLKDRGFDAQGLVEGKGASWLHGTLHLHTTEHMIYANFEEVKKQTGLMVENIMAECGKAKSQSSGVVKGKGVSRSQKLEDRETAFKRNIQIKA